MADLELFEFTRSHYNEKARWALDHKGLPFVRRSLLPGPHLLTVRRLSGQTAVPVLRHGEHVIAGSAAIIAYLEELQPEPALYPADPGERERARALQRWLDDEVGVEARRAWFAEALQDHGYLVRVFADHCHPLKRLAYRAAFPGVARAMRSAMDITPETAARALEITRAAFDRLAKEVGPSGYLVGDRFSVADLAGAALLFPAVDPPGGPGYPQPLAAFEGAWLARWADHPTAAWVCEIYRRHRHAPAAASA